MAQARNPVVSAEIVNADGDIQTLAIRANVFKTISAVSIATVATLWTPASGKKFRLMGGIVSVTGAAANTLIKEGTAGATLFIIPNSILATPIVLDFGDGILAGTVNSVLAALGTTLGVLNGTIWGTEE